jgi:hypothetical protein
MSDEQTVREAWLGSMTFSDLMAALKLDPDMMVATLQRRLLWGERVEQNIPDPQFHGQTYDSTTGRWCHTPSALYAWLTREDDQ